MVPPLCKAETGDSRSYFSNIYNASVASFKCIRHFDTMLIAVEMRLCAIHVKFTCIAKATSIPMLSHLFKVLVSSVPCIGTYHVIRTHVLSCHLLPVAVKWAENLSFFYSTVKKTRSVTTPVLCVLT